MNLRKNPEKDLRRLSGLFFQTGLLCALLLTVSAFEWSTRQEPQVVDRLDDLHGSEDFVPPITVIEEKKPPKPKKPVFIEVKKEEPDLQPEDIIKDWTLPEVKGPEPEVLPEIKEELPDDPVDYTEEMPTPAGGYEAFFKYVAENIKYPSRARNIHLQGKVFVQFVVERDGSVTDVKVLRGLGGGLDEEALRVIENSPAWNPGRQGGHRVKVRMVLPIHFRLE